jgi:hypothetical protein
MIIRTSTLYDFIFWQWSMRFEGEEVKVVALGASWVAAVTSFNYLRIFTEGGMQVCRTFTAYLNTFQFSIIEYQKHPHLKLSACLIQLFCERNKLFKQNNHF